MSDEAGVPFRSYIATNGIMDEEKARWIAENCPEGTTVKVFNGAAKKTGLRDLLTVQGYTENCRLNYSQFLDACPLENISGGMGHGAQGSAL